MAGDCQGSIISETLPGGTANTHVLLPFALSPISRLKDRGKGMYESLPIQEMDYEEASGEMPEMDMDIIFKRGGDIMNIYQRIIYFHNLWRLLFLLRSQASR